MTRCVAIIPARGGSKRLPRKNILPLGGEPMLFHAVNAARESNIFSEIYVSTEDAEIANICNSIGVEIIDRALGIATDESTVNEVCLDAINKLNLKSEDIFCCIYATAALLSADTLIASRECLGKENNFVMGVSNFNFSPVQALVEDEKGYLSYLLPEYRGVKSQHYPTTYVSNGTFYWAKVAAFVNAKTFYGDELRAYLVPDVEVCDLDTIEDFRVLEKMFEERGS